MVRAAPAALCNRCVQHCNTRGRRPSCPARPVMLNNNGSSVTVGGRLWHVLLRSGAARGSDLSDARRFMAVRLTLTSERALLLNL